MRPILVLLLMLLTASPALAFGIQGTVQASIGGPVFPCDIDIVNRQTGQPVIVAGDTTLPNGSYVLTLPNGRYDLTFHPTHASHLFNGFFQDARVNNNVVTVNQVLPPGVYLQGRVIDTGAAPVAGTNIRFKDNGGNAPNNVQSDGTLADGTFMTLVDAGLWNVEIIPPVAAHRVPVKISAVDLTGADAAVGDVVVEPGFVLTCTVTDGGFFPIADAKLTARVSPGGAKLFVPLNTTSPAGVATLVVPPGTWDITAEPPPGLAYATRTARAMAIAADQALPNFALPDGVTLSAHVIGPTSLPVANVDLDVDSLPVPVRRLEAPGDATDAAGLLSVYITTGSFRITFSPPVATRLLPVRLEPVNVSSNTGLGDIVLPQGHWVDATVRDAVTNLPIAGANLDFIRISTGALAITIDDVTGASGLARVVTDADLYQLRVIPPSASHDTLVIGNFRSLSDTTVTLLMTPHANVSVGLSRESALALSTPWPNPVRGGAVSVEFAARGNEIELSAWDVNGRRVATLWQGAASGRRTLQWQPRDPGGRRLAAGVYWLRLSDGRETAGRRLVLLP